MMHVPVSIATVNDDYNTAASNLPHLAGRYQVIMGQEGKAEDYADLLPTREFGVVQDTTSEPRSGSFIVWQRGQRLHPGVSSVIYAAPGRDDVMARYLAVKRFAPITVIDGATYRADVVVIAGHRDPRRRAELWPIWDANLLERVDRAHEAGRLVIAGCDWNEHDPAVVERAGLTWHSVGPRRIDGFACSAAIKVTNLAVLPSRSSDHQPVVGVAHLPAKRVDK